MDRPILEQVRERLEHVVVQSSLIDAEIRVLVKALTPEEAIGGPRDGGIFRSSRAKRG